MRVAQPKPAPTLESAQTMPCTVCERPPPASAVIVAVAGGVLAPKIALCSRCCLLVYDHLTPVCQAIKTGAELVDHMSAELKRAAGSAEAALAQVRSARELVEREGRPPAECAFCHAMRDVQPFGPGEKPICTECAQRPENREVAMKNFAAWVAQQVH